MSSVECIQAIARRPPMSREEAVKVLLVIAAWRIARRLIVVHWHLKAAVILSTAPPSRSSRPACFSSSSALWLPLTFLLNDHIDFAPAILGRLFCHYQLFFPVPMYASLSACIFFSVLCFCGAPVVVSTIALECRCLGLLRALPPFLFSWCLLLSIHDDARMLALLFSFR